MRRVSVHVGLPVLFGGRSTGRGRVLEERLGPGGHARFQKRRTVQCLGVRRRRNHRTPTFRPLPKLPGAKVSSRQQQTVVLRHLSPVHRNLRNCVRERMEGSLEPFGHVHLQEHVPCGGEYYGGNRRVGRDEDPEERVSSSVRFDHR